MQSLACLQETAVPDLSVVPGHAYSWRIAPVGTNVGQSWPAEPREVARCRHMADALTEADKAVLLSLGLLLTSDVCAL